jgi:hypothetical protein
MRPRGPGPREGGNIKNRRHRSLKRGKSGSYAKMYAHVINYTLAY